MKTIEYTVLPNGLYRVWQASPLTGIKNHMDLPITQKQLEAYASGTGGFIQDIFTECDPGQREFLLTGYTPQDWRVLFPGDAEC